MDDENKGTTVNERLYLNGLFDEFYAAIYARDIERTSDILKRVGLTEGAVQAILLQHNLVSKGDARST